MGNHHASVERERSGSRGDSGAAAISGEASDSQGEVGSKQLGASAANQPRGECLPSICQSLPECVCMAHVAQV